MFLKLLSVSILLSFVHGWALNCSSPEIVSDLQLDASYADISSNEKGDVFLVWCSELGRNTRLESSYKTQNSLWSSPEPLSSWDRTIYSQRSFVNTLGDPFAIWEIEREEELFLTIAEKIKENLWHSSQAFSNAGFSDFDAGLDSAGSLIFLKKEEVLCAPKNSRYTSHKDTVPAIALYTKSPNKIEKKHISLLDPACYYTCNLKITPNKNGISYAVWVSSKSDANLVMCQQIVNNQFVLEPKIVNSSQNFIYELKTDMNEKGDVLVAYVDSQNNGTLVTKTGNTWSEPFLFSKKEELENLHVAIDHVGNMMVVWEAEIDGAGIVKAMYKPVDQVWQNPISFTADHMSNCYPNVQPDGAGNFIVIWQQEQRKHNSIIGSAFSTTTESWSDPQRLSPESVSCFDCTYTFWAPGKGYVAWTMSPNGYDQAIQVAELAH